MCATNSAGLSVRAKDFFGTWVWRSSLSSTQTNTVRLRRSKSVGREPDGADSNVPTCDNFQAPDRLSDGDILSAIRIAVASPRMRGMPRSLERITIEPEGRDEGLSRIWIRFNWNGGPDEHWAHLSRTNGNWQLVAGGRAKEF
jgi:hypothetical protein